MDYDWTTIRLIKKVDSISFVNDARRRTVSVNMHECVDENKDTFRRVYKQTNKPRRLCVSTFHSIRQQSNQSKKIRIACRHCRRPDEKVLKLEIFTIDGFYASIYTSRSVFLSINVKVPFEKTFRMRKQYVYRSNHLKSGTHSNSCRWNSVSNRLDSAFDDDDDDDVTRATNSIPYSRR